MMRKASVPGARERAERERERGAKHRPGVACADAPRAWLVLAPAPLLSLRGRQCCLPLDRKKQSVAPSTAFGTHARTFQKEHTPPSRTLTHKQTKPYPPCSALCSRASATHHWACGASPSNPPLLSPCFCVYLLCMPARTTTNNPLCELSFFLLALLRFLFSETDILLLLFRVLKTRHSKYHLDHHFLASPERQRGATAAAAA